MKTIILFLLMAMIGIFGSSLYINTDTPEVFKFKATIFFVVVVIVTILFIINNELERRKYVKIYSLMQDLMKNNKEIKEIINK
jgi:DMSO reductase anchor subunit